MCLLGWYGPQPGWFLWEYYSKNRFSRQPGPANCREHDQASCRMTKAGPDRVSANVHSSKPGLGFLTARAGKHIMSLARIEARCTMRTPGRRALRRRSGGEAWAPKGASGCNRPSLGGRRTSVRLSHKGVWSVIPVIWQQGPGPSRAPAGLLFSRTRTRRFGVVSFCVLTQLQRRSRL